MYYGLFYYWYEGQGTILHSAHFGTAERYIEETHLFDQDETERMEGGYFKPFLRVKQPPFGQTVDILKNFKFDSRSSFALENEKLSVPKCNIYTDEL
jgi:hypothetical protein